MKKYKYTAMNLQRQKVSGTFIAENEKDLAIMLARQDLFLMSCSTSKSDTPSSFFTMGTGTVTIGEMTTFCRQYSIMINAGISVLEGLECLREQSFSKYFKSLLDAVYEDVKGGISLSDAFNKHKNAFPAFFRNMIYVGEASGKMDKVLSCLADYYEKDNEIKKKTKSAFAYPIMLGCMTVGIVILMLVFIVPTFKNTLSSMEVEITGFTKVVYDISDFLTAYWLWMLAGIGVLGVGIVIFSRSKTGKYCFDWIKMNAPVLKRVNTDIITSRFARAFALLLSSGLDITQALDAVAVVIGNQCMEEKFKKAAEEVRHGSRMADSFEKYHMFPQVMIQMVAVGERTAALDEVLNRSGSYFDEQVETSLNSAVSKIQPIMLIIMGGVIGSLFLAVYSPIISIMTGIGA